MINLKIPTKTVLSPGKYYYAHIRPAYNEHDKLIHGYAAADPVYADKIPTDVLSTPIVGSDWLAATTYSPKIKNLIIWLSKPSASGSYHGMRFANVPSYHLDGLHGSSVAVKSGRAITKTIPRELTDNELNSALRASFTDKQIYASFRRTTS